MNKRIRALKEQATRGAMWPGDPDAGELDIEKFAELMIAEFSDVVKTTANELAEFYTKQGSSEQEVLMRVNGALVVLGHIRARFKD